MGRAAQAVEIRAPPVASVHERRFDRAGRRGREREGHDADREPLRRDERRRGRLPFPFRRRRISLEPDRVDAGPPEGLDAPRERPLAGGAAGHAAADVVGQSPQVLLESRPRGQGLGDEPLGGPSAGGAAASVTAASAARVRNAGAFGRSSSLLPRPGGILRTFRLQAPELRLSPMSIEGGVPGMQQRLVCPKCGKVFFAWRPDTGPGAKVKCYFCKHEFEDEAARRPPLPAPAPAPAASGDSRPRALRLPLRNPAAAARFSRKADSPSLASSEARRSAIVSTVSSIACDRREPRDAADQALRDADGLRARRQERVDLSAARRFELLGRHDLVHEADPKRLPRVEAVARQEEVARMPRADRAQDVRRDDGRQDPELHLGEREHGPLRRDGDVARRRRGPRLLRSRARGRAPRPASGRRRSRAASGHPPRVGLVLRARVASRPFASTRRRRRRRTTGPSPWRITTRVAASSVERGERRRQLARSGRRRTRCARRAATGRRGTTGPSRAMRSRVGLDRRSLDSSAKRPERSSGTGRCRRPAGARRAPRSGARPPLPPTRSRRRPPRGARRARARREVERVVLLRMEEESAASRPTRPPGRWRRAGTSAPATLSGNENGLRTETARRRLALEEREARQLDAPSLTKLRGRVSGRPRRHRAPRQRRLSSPPLLPGEALREAEVEASRGGTDRPSPRGPRRNDRHRDPQTAARALGRRRDRELATPSRRARECPRRPGRRPRRAPSITAVKESPGAGRIATSTGRARR